MAIGFFDVYYSNDSAHGACVLIDNFKDAAPKEEHELDIHGIAPYEPGFFSKRELPIILEMIDKIGKDKFNIIVVDAYVSFTEDHHGLGYNLYKALDGKIPVIGVAKTKFKTENQSMEVVRGKSAKPLYVTAIGMNKDYASECIKSMDGAYRIPTIIKETDALSRKKIKNICENIW